MKYLENYKTIAERYQGSDYDGLEELLTVANNEDTATIKRLMQESWNEESYPMSKTYPEDKVNLFEKYGFIFEMGDIIGYEYNNSILECGYSVMY